jgi:hypothetical protein
MSDMCHRTHNVDRESDTSQKNNAFFDRHSALEPWSYTTQAWGSRVARFGDAIDWCAPMFECPRSVTQVVFLSAFSGHAECHFLDALVARGCVPGLRRVIFQDVWFGSVGVVRPGHVLGGVRAPTESEFGAFWGAWDACCARHGALMAVVDSYQRLERDLRAQGRRSLFVGINASICHSRGIHLPERSDPNEARALADVWAWAARTRAAGPFLFVRGTMLARASSDGWW